MCPFVLSFAAYSIGASPPSGDKVRRHTHTLVIDGERSALEFYQLTCSFV
jgi:hypothetical protein